MQFVKTSRRKQNVANSTDVGRYPHQLQLYNLPPTDNISLREFEDFAVERLKVLKVVETVGIRHLKGTEAYKEAIQKEMNTLYNQGIMKGLLKRHSPTQEPEQLDIRRKDHISHFILRLAYCRTEELRRWFIAQELDLFRHRFCQESKDNIYEFLQLNNLDYQPISDNEKSEISNQLSAACPRVTCSSMNFYKVPFTEALDLVKHRRVYLRGGYAYVPENDLVVIILTVYRTKLSHALAVTCRSIPHLEEDDRLLPMLNGLSKRYLGQDYSNKKPVAGVITAEMIEGLSKKAFPMCMQQTHQAMKQHHHLKHWGRMQYGLFLKGIGLSLDEAMKFWRKEFLKACDPDKFDKTYAYNIRHNYGKEGKRADYTPYSCIKIITSNAPGPGDHHGCPFRHSDGDMLRQRLQAQMMPRDVVDDIVSLCKTSHYQLACGQYFSWSHKQTPGFNPNHPNQYFEESQKIVRGDKPNSSEKVLNESQLSQKVKIVPSQQSQKSQNAPDKSIMEDDFDADMDAAMLSMDTTD